MMVNRSIAVFVGIVYHEHLAAVTLSTLPNCLFLQLLVILTNNSPFSRKHITEVHGPTVETKQKATQLRIFSKSSGDSNVLTFFIVTCVHYLFIFFPKSDFEFYGDYQVIKIVH